MLNGGTAPGSLGMVELGTCIRQSGGDYIYVMQTYGGVVGFLYAWLSIMFLRPAGIAITALMCAEYVLTPFFGSRCVPADTQVAIIKMLAIIVIGEAVFLIGPLKV